MTRSPRQTIVVSARGRNTLVEVGAATGSQGGGAYRMRPLRGRRSGRNVGGQDSRGKPVRQMSFRCDFVC